MSLSGIDFPGLSLRDAYDLAILIEEEAAERYEEFAHQMEIHHTPEAAEFFRTMVRNERKHGALLAEQRARRFGDAPRTVTRAMLWDVEAPDYDQARALMTAREAMSAALRAEEKAYAFFAAALPQLHEPEVRALFTELRDEELVHQTLVTNELVKLPPDSAVAPDAFEDDPTAQ